MGSAAIEEVIGGLDRFIEREIVRLVAELHHFVVLRTPVDLGWARANFVPAISAPHREDLKDRDPDGGAVQSKKADTSARLASVVAGYRLSRGPIFISNNVPYIGRLNDGHSPQAPPGYIGDAIREAIAEMGRGGVRP